ncbi:hypothetical protein C8J56DRAFT_1048075 [Mycena floridula]|nr:hypothetical protein C8J56DRAFT_1048075 [Mycena floridula]
MQVIPLTGLVDEPQLPSLQVKHMLLNLARFSTDHQALVDLKRLVDELVASNVSQALPTGSIPTGASVSELGQRCKSLDSKVDAYNYFHAVIQLRLTTQWLAAEATRQNKTAKASKTRVPDFAAEAKVTYPEMKRYLNHGTKLIYLSGAASPYILFLLASIGEAKSYLESNWDLTSGIGTELACERTPTDPHTQLIKLFIIPVMDDIRAYIGDDKSNPFFSFFCDAKELHFHETSEITEYLRTRDTKWFEHSPPHQTFYDFLQGYKEDIQFVPTFLMDPLPPLVPVSIKEASTHTLILDQFKLGKQPNPFGPHVEDSSVWTAAERILAKNAEALESIEELEEFMLESFKDGLRQYEDYGYLDTDILEGRRLKILDRDGGTALYVVPGLQKAYPWLNEAITYKMSILEPGFRYVKDGEVLPSFIAEQMILYNRYGARGHKDHPDIHPFFNHTIGPKKVLRSMQSVPYQSNLIREDPEGAKIRDTIFPIVFQVIQQAMSSGLLSEYDELEITVQELPFDTSSAARPFTGYIININVTTDGHLHYGQPPSWPHSWLNVHI